MTFQTILTKNELNTFWAKSACLDPSFALKSKRFYEERSAAQLKALAAQAWSCNERDAHVLARSYLALAN